MSMSASRTVLHARRKSIQEFGTILCPVDFSPSSDRAFEFALGLARSAGSKLHLFHVARPLMLSASPTGIAAVGTSAVQTRKHVVRRLDQLLTRCQGEDVSAVTTLEAGDVLAELESATETLAPDLVVMGTHGLGRIERFLLGSVTQRMVRQSPSPVLTVPPKTEADFELPPGIRRVLVTTDFTAGIGIALDHAVGLLGTRDGEVRLLHVVPRAEAAADALSAITTILDEYSEGLSPEFRRHAFIPEVEVGTPNRLIARVAERIEPDLVVVKAHDKGILGRMFAGSTVEKVLRKVPRPILVVPDDVEEDGLPA